MGAICSLILTLFIGIGSIVQGNAGKLSNQKLSLRTDGCYLNTTTVSPENYFIATSPEDDLSLSPRFNTAWKDEEYSALNNLFGISYLWLPAITVASTIIFGLIFSIIINMTMKKRALVKVKHLTPIVAKMWVKILGKERLLNWIDFSTDDDTDKKKNDANNRSSSTSKSNSIKLVSFINNNSAGGGDDGGLSKVENTILSNGYGTGGELIENKVSHALQQK